MINNKYYAIDSHCHIYPEKIASLAINHTDEFYDVRSHHKGTFQDLIESKKESGIDKYIVQSVATTPHQVKSINEFIAKNVAINSDTLIGLGTIHPRSEDIIGDIHHLVDLGLHGIKIHPDIQNFNADDEGYLKMYKECEKLSLPVLVHTGDSRYDHSNPNRIVPILEKFPNLTMIGAHFGGWSIWETAVKEYERFSNFYVDCSSSFFYISMETAKELILRYGTDRVLFATDYPMWNAKTEIDTLLKMELSDSDYEKIFSKNAMEVYKLK